MIGASSIKAIVVRTDKMVTVYNLRRQRAPGEKLLQATGAIFSLPTQLDTRMDTAGDYELLPDVFNRKLAHFIALTGRSAGGAVVKDALMFNWSQETSYIFSLVQIVARVLQRLE
jgi:hypothetical protein